MPKYQFFKLEQTARDEYRWLDMADDTFLAQKTQFINQRFEVVGDVIYADNEQDAIAKFNSGIAYPLEEYNKAHGIGGIFYAAKGIYEEIKDWRQKRS